MPDTHVIGLFAGLLLFVAGCSPPTEEATEWPSLRGPYHTNVSLERDIITDWPDSGPDEKWRVPVGLGYCSPVARDNRVVVLHRIENEEIVECFDAETGTSLWQHKYPTTFKCQFDYSDGPYSTPVIDDKHVYAVGGQGQFHCLDLRSGEVIWQRLLHEEHVVEEALFAVGASPLLEDDRLIFNLGARDDEAGIIALDKNSGKTLWKATEDKASYATPFPATIHGRRMVFVVTFEGLVAINPADGTVYWSFECRPRAPASVNATSPVVYEDMVLMVTGPGPGGVCLRVLPDGGYEEVWRDRRVLDSQFNALVLIDDHVYGYSSKQMGGVSFRCVEFETGELKWKWVSPLERGSVIAADGRFILWGENGHLGSLDITPTEAVPGSMTKEPLLEQPCYSAPALHRGLLYLRNEKTLLCLDLRKRKTKYVSASASTAP